MNFNISVISEKDFYLNDELQMIKSALLYADEINVISPNLVQALSLYQIYGNDFLEKTKIPINVYNQIIQDVKDQEDKTVSFKYLDNKYTVNSKRKAIELIKEMYHYSNNVDQNYLNRTIQISDLVKRNIISCYNNYCEEDLFNVKASERIYKDLFNDFLKTFSNKDSFNFYNKEIYDLFNILFNKNNLSEFDIEKLKHTNIMSNLITGLPNFEYAEIDEILDIKKELSSPLTNFRSKIFEFSEQIKSQPWSKDFEYECEKLYHKDIAPAINEIDQKIRDNNIYKNITNTLFNKEFLVSATAAITGGIVSGLATALSTMTVGAFTDIKSGINRNKETKAEIENNNLYFYYKASKKFEKIKKK